MRKGVSAVCFVANGDIHIKPRVSECNERNPRSGQMNDSDAEGVELCAVDVRPLQGRYDLAAYPRDALAPLVFPRL